MKENSPIIASQVEEHIDGPMEAPMKEKSRMDFATGMASTALMMQLTKENGFKEKNTERGKLYSRVALSSKELLETI